MPFYFRVCVCSSIAQRSFAVN